MKLLLPLQSWWNNLGANEKSGIFIASSLAFLLLGWYFFLAPALRTLKTADLELRLLNAQQQQMQGLQNEVRLLQARPKMTSAQSALVLESLTKEHFGAAGQFRVAGERVTVSLRNAPAEALSQWLVQARLKANTLPSEAHLVRSAPLPAAPNATNNTHKPGANWDGTLILVLRGSP